jgi:hypothetical protein
MALLVRIGHRLQILLELVHNFHMLLSDIRHRLIELSPELLLNGLDISLQLVSVGVVLGLKFFDLRGKFFTLLSLIGKVSRQLVDLALLSFVVLLELGEPLRKQLLDFLSHLTRKLYNYIE